jgi:hypothetical protein
MKEVDALRELTADEKEQVPEPYTDGMMLDMARLGQRAS